MHAPSPHLSLSPLPLALAAGLLIAALPARAADRFPAPKLIEMSRTAPNSPEFRDALVATLGETRIRDGRGVSGQGPDFIWAIESDAQPTLVVDDETRAAMTRIAGSSLWFETGQLTPGRTHTYHFMVNGQEKGGDLNLPAYLPESYAQPGVPQGTLSPMITHASHVYEGMETQYWIYVPAEYDPKVPVGVMVWNDGGSYVNRDGSRLQNVIDNLTYQKKIPVLIHVLVAPGRLAGTPAPGSPESGMRPGASLRSIEYDTVTDRFPKFLRDEILADVAKKYNLRTDAYSRGIAGESSGGIAAFNAAYQMPDLFSRVLSRVGTYTSIQWHPGTLDGGNIYPFLIRKEKQHKNIRVWLSDGCEDLENEFGSWPLQNIQMANSLKMQAYDFHFSFGNGSHSGAWGNAEAPISLTWLWRDYDPNKTEQTYEMDPAEKSKPYFRVHIYNRQ